jgi:hypothetical protein
MAGQVKAVAAGTVTDVYPEGEAGSAKRPDAGYKDVHSARRPDPARPAIRAGLSAWPGFAPIRFASMRRVKTSLVLWALLVPLMLAPVAHATNDGRGLYGETNDKVVTDVGFILIVGFPLFVFLMSMLQRALEKRKDARKAAQKAHVSNAQWRGGW